MRQVASAARANVAAISYYFGGVEGLEKAIVAERIQPLNARRVRMLAESAAAGSAASAMGEVLRLLVEPVLACGSTPEISILARSLSGSESSPAERLLADDTRATLGRFAQVLRKSVPSLPPDDFLWRLSFVAGSMQHLFANWHRMAELTHGICRNQDLEQAVDRFVTCSRGMLLGTA